MDVSSGRKGTLCSDFIGVPDRSDSSCGTCLEGRCVRGMRASGAVRYLGMPVPDSTGIESPAVMGKSLGHGRIRPQTRYVWMGSEQADSLAQVQYSTAEGGAADCLRLEVNRECLHQIPPHKVSCRSDEIREMGNGCPLPQCIRRPEGM